VPVLHSWIQNHAVAEHMLVDVSDYGHVHNGPGTLLVSHEANFYLDRIDGRLGLTYARKQAAPGAFVDRLRQTITAALEACVRLEDDPKLAGRIKFGGSEVTSRCDRRLLAPNTMETSRLCAATWNASRRTCTVRGTSSSSTCSPTNSLSRSISATAGAMPRVSSCSTLSLRDGMMNVSSASMGAPPCLCFERNMGGTPMLRLGKRFRVQLHFARGRA
jgi:hypothetical protein